MQETNNSNNISLDLEEQRHSLDERCKLVILSLHKDVQQSISVAVNKSIHMLEMLQKLEKDKTSYDSALQLLQQQKLSLRKGIQVSAVSNLADHQPQGLESIDESLHKNLRKKLSRFQSTFSKNKQLCQKQYQTLLRQTPLLAHYHAFPNACSNLLYLSPNHWIKSLSKLLQAAPTTHQMSQTIYQLNELVVLNFFICELKTHYVSIQGCLEDILSEEDVLPFKHAANLKSAKNISVIKGPYSLSNKEEPQKTLPENENEKPEQNEKHDPLAKDHIVQAPLRQSSAIEKQEQLIQKQSEFAKYQLESMSLGSLLFWQHGINEQQGQTLKLVHKEKDLFTFHVEETGLFARYAPSELVEAIINGRLYPHSEKKRSKKRFMSKFIPKGFL
ncbi:MAG: hypothetical protein VX185_07315 [Pseudomonadota bacterium]|nr:hypothetical protein [Pseudomonadota bacterium]